MNKQKLIWDPLDFSKKVVITVSVVAFFLFLLFLLQHITYLLFIIFAGILLAAFFSGITKVVQNYIHLPRPFAMITAIFAVLALIAAFSWISGSTVVSQFETLVEILPEALEKLGEKLSRIELIGALIDRLPSAEAFIPSATGLLDEITVFFSSFFGLVMNLFIIFFLGIYLAVDPALYVVNLFNLLPQSRRARAMEVFYVLDRSLKWWLIGRFAAMAVTGVATGVGLYIIGVPSALTIGIIAATLSFIPFLGPLMAYILASLVSFAVSPWTVAIVALLFIGTQAFENYYLVPTIERRALHVPQALTIAMQILLGVIAGALGIILAAPLTVVIIVLLQMLYIEDVLEEESDIPRPKIPKHYMELK